MNTVLWLALLVPIAFVQNAVFTLVSRSRNSGNPERHRWAAYASNGIWLVCNGLVFRGFWEFYDGGDLWAMVVMGLVYTLSTTEGSVRMMELNLGYYHNSSNRFLQFADRLFNEKGVSQVGKR
jgi:hypothetical protein